MKKNTVLFFLMMFFLSISNLLALEQTEIANFISKYKGRSIFNKEYINNKSKYGLIIIEDAHCNYPVQQEIKKNVETLITDIKGTTPDLVPLLLQEGGNKGAIRTDLIKKKKTAQELKLYIDEKFKNGEMGAAEYLKFKDDNFNFWGIEDKELYDENYKYFIKIAQRRNLIAKFLDDLEGKLKELKTIIFSDELKEFYKNSLQEVKQDNIIEYLESIRLYTLQYKIDMTKYKTMLRYFDTQKALTRLNKEKLDKDLAFVSQKIKRTPDLEKLPELLADNIITLSETPELYRYAKLRSFFLDTDMFAFIKEKDKIEKELFAQIAYTNEEKELVKILRYFFIVKKILSFTLTNDEYAYYQDQLESNINPLIEVLNYVKSYYTNYKTSLPLDIIYNDAKHFYIAVDKRDHVLVKNIIDSMNKNRVNIAIAVLGGFHTEGMTNLFKAEGISYAVITPEIDEVTDYSDVYYSVMEKFWSK